MTVNGGGRRRVRRRRKDREPGWDPPEVGPRPVGSVLGDVARDLDIPDAAPMSRLAVGWAGLVGAQVAAHTRPGALRDGCLVVLVDDPTWTSQLRFLEPELVTRLNAELGPGTVTELRWRTARG